MQLFAQNAFGWAYPKCRQDKDLTRIYRLRNSPRTPVFAGKTCLYESLSDFRYA